MARQVRDCRSAKLFSQPLSEADAPFQLPQILDNGRRYRGRLLIYLSHTDEVGIRGPLSTRWLVEGLVFSDLELFDFRTEVGQDISPRATKVQLKVQTSLLK